MMTSCDFGFVTAARGYFLRDSLMMPGEHRSTAALLLSTTHGVGSTKFDI